MSDALTVWQGKPVGMMQGQVNAAIGANSVVITLQGIDSTYQGFASLAAIDATGVIGSVVTTSNTVTINFKTPCAILTPINYMVLSPVSI